MPIGRIDLRRRTAAATAVAALTADANAQTFDIQEDQRYMIGAVRPPTQDYYGIASTAPGNVPDPTIAEHVHEVPVQFYFKQ